MKISENWLREWAKTPLPRAQLCERLTLSGLEVEEVLSAENDAVLSVAITPNRGDCLSVKGLAQETAAITSGSYTPLEIKKVSPQVDEVLSVKLNSPQACAQYCGRIIRDVNANAETPQSLKQKLLGAGLSCISPVVDIMNYVMLELGQPMHAFDLDKITGEIIVRTAEPEEEITLLDGQTKKLDDSVLVIADKKKPLAIAGIMGGLDSGVTLLTQHVFLESAWFNPAGISRTARALALGSESSYRFERGVDPELQMIALERAAQLILEICGGKPGPVVHTADKKYLPASSSILLRPARIEKILGFPVKTEAIEAYLDRLQFKYKKESHDFLVEVPARRPDLILEIDLIEEIARLFGYENIPQQPIHANLQMHAVPENKISAGRLREQMKDLGYHEVITYSFVDKTLQSLLDPDHASKPLLNPITEDMNVMRTNLWPGLLKTLIYNQNRQQTRCRFFEIGLRFRNDKQERVIAGLTQGLAFPEQWGVSKREVDFFDLKSDLENIFNVSLKAGRHPALHSGQTADILYDGKEVGIMGALHPELVQHLKIEGRVFLFEILLEDAARKPLPRFQEISKFPEIRRDIAIVVDAGVTSQEIQEFIKEKAGNLLREVHVFDVYQGKGIPAHRKSIALGLSLQHSDRTLTDEEVADLIGRVIVALKEKFAAELRG